MQYDKDELLNQAKLLLKDEVTQIAYSTWFQRLEIAEMTDDHIVFKAFSEYHHDLLTTRYADLILNGDPEAYLKAVTQYKPLD